MLKSNFSCRRLAFIALVLALCGGCALRPKAPAPVTLRVMTYNIHHGEGLDGKVDLARIAELIKPLVTGIVMRGVLNIRTRRVSPICCAISPVKFSQAASVILLARWAIHQMLAVPIINLPKINTAAVSQSIKANLTHANGATVAADVSRAFKSVVRPAAIGSTFVVAGALPPVIGPGVVLEKVIFGAFRATSGDCVSIESESTGVDGRTAICQTGSPNDSIGSARRPASARDQTR